MSRLAWHFLHPGGRLLTGELAPPDGKWLVHRGSVEPCVSGLHASERAVDALKYAPTRNGVVLCRVELRGTILEDGYPVDKLVASERRVLWRLDGATTDGVLREFARWCALQVLHLWEAPPVVRQYLETGDESLREAALNAAEVARGARRGRATEWVAACDAAINAATETNMAPYAADEAARAVARAAARGQPTVATVTSWGRVVMRSEAWWTAFGVEWDAQNTKLEELFNAAHAAARGQA